MSLIRDTDLGTPASNTGRAVKVEIDGLPATVKAGDTILRAARECGVDIPKLCATDNLKPFGSCRLCLVEIDGRKGEISLEAKITDRVQPGVVYTTFHDPETGANVVTTEYSDWATNCPEYKVTAVQVAPAVHRSKWQHEFEKRAKTQGRILEATD